MKKEEKNRGNVNSVGLVAEWWDRLRGLEVECGLKKSIIGQGDDINRRSEADLKAPIQT